MSLVMRNYISKIEFCDACTRLRKQNWIRFLSKKSQEKCPSSLSIWKMSIQNCALCAKCSNTILFFDLQYCIHKWSSSLRHNGWSECCAGTHEFHRYAHFPYLDQLASTWDSLQSVPWWIWRRRACRPSTPSGSIILMIIHDLLWHYIPSLYTHVAR